MAEFLRIPKSAITIAEDDAFIIWGQLAWHLLADFYPPLSYCEHIGDRPGDKTRDRGSSGADLLRFPRCQTDRDRHERTVKAGLENDFQNVRIIE